jgi:hypothetical protein
MSSPPKYPLGCYFLYFSVMPDPTRVNFLHGSLPKLAELYKFLLDEFVNLSLMCMV